MDLLALTRRSLDWDFVLEHLARHARTLPGAARAREPDFAASLAEALARQEAVAEVWVLEGEGERIPVGTVRDVSGTADRARRGEVLDAGELLEVAETLRALSGLRGWLSAREAAAPRLCGLATPIAVDPALAERLERSFDAAGQISGVAWPEVAELRRRVEQARGRILRTLEEMLRSESLGAALQDRYVTERDGRYVLPVKAAHRKGLGIVHGRSQSGETFFIEPAEVVELTNDLRAAESELQREIRRVLSLLSREVGLAHGAISVSTAAATEVDLACARAALGRTLDGVLPRLGQDGVLHLQAARHPVLALRGVAVVPNDLRLDSRAPALVLTGPNTGGKTVALKTLGLAALFAKAGIPFPAGADSRVDFFGEVMADVGDLQAIEEDISTFSGHIAVIRDMLAAAGPGSLVLLDEVTAGTDPHQGAALARAVLEAVVDAGARVAVTTHFTELKALGAADPRFTVAAFRYEDGRPTWRLEPGVAGDSHAFGVAARLGLPPAVLTRARALLEPEARALSNLLEALEAERNSAAAKSEALAAQARELRLEAKALAERAASLETREREVRRRLTAEFQERLRAREKEIKAMIAALQEAPGLKLAGTTLDAIRLARAEATLPAPEPAPPPAPQRPLAVGDRVRLLTLGQKGRVVAISGEDRLEVEAGAMRIRVRRDEVEPVDKGGVAARPAKDPASKGTPTPPPESPPARASLGLLRLPANTCDLRGMRVEEALDAVDRFLVALGAQGGEVGWILHGHGTGALKQAVRDWLPTVPGIRRWRPADTDEGGDAFTVIEVG